MIDKWLCFFSDNRLPTGIAFSAIKDRHITITYLAMSDR
jgi:hypothetical protein